MFHSFVASLWLSFTGWWIKQLKQPWNFYLFLGIDKDHISQGKLQSMWADYTQQSVWLQWDESVRPQPNWFELVWAPFGIFFPPPRLNPTPSRKINSASRIRQVFGRGPIYVHVCLCKCTHVVFVICTTENRKFKEMSWKSNILTKIFHNITSYQKITYLHMCKMFVFSCIYNNVLALNTDRDSLQLNALLAYDPLLPLFRFV